MGVTARVVSAMDRTTYRPDCSVPRVSLEAGVTSGWRGLVDLPIGIDDFGASGPGGAVMAHYGMSIEAVTVQILDLLGHHPEVREEEM